jgi:hypothetical protein
VYLAEIKLRGIEPTLLRIIRMQKWGVREHLDEGKDLLSSIVEAEEYTEYILDRRLGCRQLGMHLTPRTSTRKIVETYAGQNARYRGTTIWSAYFERDYIPGAATDKIPGCRFADQRFAIGFARLLGQAAAPNLIVGRCDLKGDVVFDDGDELIIEGPDGVPVQLMVADHTGTFTDYRRELSNLVPSYANAILKRAALVPDPRAFADAFVEAFERRLFHIQGEYRKRRRAFNTLFKHKYRDEKGSFAYRWEMILARLESADLSAVVGRLRKNLELTDLMCVMR